MPLRELQENNGGNMQETLFLVKLFLILLFYRMQCMINRHRARRPAGTQARLDSSANKKAMTALSPSWEAKKAFMAYSFHRCFKRTEAITGLLLRFEYL
jgi:hypothetical protein